MIHIEVNGQIFSIPGELVAHAIIDSMPGFLTGKTQATGKAALFKSAVKAFMPTALSMAHKRIVDEGLPIPPPDLKSPEARENVIVYALAYMLSNMLQLSNNAVFSADYEVLADGSTVLVGIRAPAECEQLPALAESAS